MRPSPVRTDLPGIVLRHVECNVPLARGEDIRYLVELPLAPRAMVTNAMLEWRSVR